MVSSELARRIVSDPDALVRHVARDNFEAYMRYQRPDLDVAGFHRNYYRVLDMFAHKRIKRLIISAPPQAGKSEGSSRGLPSFIEGMNPDTKLVIASYSLQMARQFNRACQRLMGSYEFRTLFPDSLINDSGVRQYNTYQCSADQTDMVGHQGFIKAVGRGGGLTGIPVDVAILDDVYKDFKEANSPIIREQAWNWYTSVVRTRLHKDSQEIIVFTRWHEDDIIGRIEKSGEPIVVAKTWAEGASAQENAWGLGNFPAIKVGPPTEIDPREPGEALWPERHPIEELEERRRLDPNLFECLYQGDPGSSEGRLYRDFRTYADRGEWGRCVRKGAYIDVADEGDDFLAAVCYDVYLSDNRVWDEAKRRYVPLIYLLVTDFVYTQDGTDVTYITVPNMLNLNGTQKAWVESNAGGAQFEKNIRGKVRARTEPFHQQGNKESRIVSNAAEVNSRIIMPVGWESRWPEVYAHLSRFLRYFKGNTHDDIEDALTGAYEKEVADGYMGGYHQRARGIRRVN